MKLILWLVLILVVLHLLRKKKAGLAASLRAAASAAKSDGLADRGAGEIMLPCAHCGVHIPQSEAISVSPGLAFCSDAHRRLHHTP